MAEQFSFPIDPKLDLVLERVVDVPPGLVWEAWTKPEHLIHWFCPRPWSVAECEIDLRPGGLFRTRMCSASGELLPASDGCYLEVVENSRLVWTSAMGPGFRPLRQAEGDGFVFTAYILLEPQGKGTRYTAISVHPDAASRAKHEEIGFHEGWSAALDQLEQYMRDLKV